MNRRQVGYRLWLEAFSLMTRASLRGTWLHGDLPPGPLVWASNHHGWWDAFVAAAVLDGARRRPLVLVDEANLAAFRFLPPAGVVSTGAPLAGLRELRAGRSLIVFPEGEMHGPGSVRPLHGGAAWYAQAARVPLVPVALRVVLRGQQHPEALVRVGAPVAGEHLRAAMTRELDLLDADIAAHDPSAPLPGYRQVVLGRRSMHEIASAATGLVRR